MEYVIHSKAERGFWNNDLGWVHDVNEATRFSQPTIYFPVSAHGEWMCVHYPE